MLRIGCALAAAVTLIETAIVQLHVGKAGHALVRQPPVGGGGDGRILVDQHPHDDLPRHLVVRHAHGLVAVEPRHGQRNKNHQPDREQPGQECVGFVFHQSSCVESEAAATASVISGPSAIRARLPRSPRKYSLMNGWSI